MQRLVAIGFRDGNIVLEFTGHRLVQTVHHTQCAVTVVYRIDQQAEGKDVHDLRKRLPLRFHLAVNAEQVFFSTHDCRGKALAI